MISRRSSAHFVEKLSAYLTAPATGEYVFRLSADEEAELYLESDSVDAREWAPGDRAPAAEVRAAVAPGDFDTDVRQQTYPIVLPAGQRYLVTVVHKEGTGRDHGSPAWQLPGTTDRTLLDGRFLGPAREGGEM